MSIVKLAHFSDVLCVWAYVAQIRMDELHHEFGAQVDVEYRFTPIFGAARDMLAKRWKDTGGFAAYGAHVRGVGAKFDHVTIHPEIWIRVTPHSSMPAHLYLCAVRLLERSGGIATGALRAVTWAIREAFFRDVVDIADQRVLLALGEAHGIPPAAVEDELVTGRAQAELCIDHQLAKDSDVRISPSLLLNDGRQRLNGNVGYRVISANVREILEVPNDLMKSWC